MIILDKKVIYIKVPKTGSSTITTSIWERYGMKRLSLHDNVVNLNFVENKGPRGHWHVSFKKIEKYLGDEIRDYVSFTTIRDPLDRIISAYRWSAQKVPDNPLFQSLEWFLRTVEEEPESLNWFLRMHCAPQVYWLRNLKGEIDPNMRIFTLERLSECVGFFQEHLAFTPQFGRVNESIKRTVDVNDRVKSIVDRMYGEDYELYHKHCQAA